ncbi:MAG: HAD hydrolase family protein [Abditibacteriota bacterium]|nr:HAD hydrolase family protein [Abditibacteriota bacterium]
MLAMDVDGTQTDGSMVVFEKSTIKFFNARDGLATNIALRCGILVFWISGGFSEAVETRAKAMGITGLLQGCPDKGSALVRIALENGIPIEQTAFIGDDLNDIPAIKAAGTGIAVGDAAPECKRCADHVTEAPGGKGAVREVVERILRERGLWEDICADFEKYAITDKPVSQ